MNETTQSLALLGHYNFDGDVDGMIARIVCPFHNDTEPSLWIYVDQASAHCYACNWHGSVLDIVCQLEKVNQLQALMLLTKWAKNSDVKEVGALLTGRPVPERRPNEDQLRRYASLPSIVDSETRAEAYMCGRGFTEQTLRFFDVRVDDGSEWPVVYPILQWDCWTARPERGKVLCWQRRRIDHVDTHEKPKYKWSKGARFSTYVAGWLQGDDGLMTEGYLDMMMGWQHLNGAVPVFSPLTWYLREHQAKQLRYTRVIGALDNDQKGREGLDRAAMLIPNFVPFEWDTAEKDVGETDSMSFAREFYRATHRRHGRG